VMSQAAIALPTRPAAKMIATREVARMGHHLVSRGELLKQCNRCGRVPRLREAPQRRLVASASFSTIMLMSALGPGGGDGAYVMLQAFIVRERRPDESAS
jgi:hypothetical protein